MVRCNEETRTLWRSRGFAATVGQLLRVARAGAVVRASLCRISRCCAFARVCTGGLPHWAETSASERRSVEMRQVLKWTALQFLSHLHCRSARLAAAVVIQTCT